MPRAPFRTARSASAGMVLEDVLARLERSPHVDGLAVIGSLANGTPGTASDIDLLVVLTDPVPGLSRAPGEPFEVVFTHVGGRPADVILTTVAELRRASSEPLLRWLSEGRVVVDDSGALAEAARRDRPEPWRETDVLAAWWGLGFAVVKAERYAKADDGAYREAAEWIATDAGTGALVAYFKARGLPWAGERKALELWAAEDTRFLDLARAFFAATGLERIRTSRALAAHALEPVGGLWPAGAGPHSEAWEYLLQA